MNHLTVHGCIFTSSNLFDHLTVHGCIFTSSNLFDLLPPPSPLPLTAVHSRFINPLLIHDTLSNCAVSVAASGPLVGSFGVAAGTVEGPGKGRRTTPEDDFIWGSVTKVHTGVSTLRKIAEGKLSLDTKVAKLIDPLIATLEEKDFKSVTDLFGPQAQEITVEDLLHMTSGVPDFDTAKPWGPEGPGW